jgi:hypothetical protein
MMLNHTQKSYDLPTFFALATINENIPIKENIVD